MGVCHPNFGQTLSYAYLFVGSYTEGKEGYGIHVFKFDESNGTLTQVEEVSGLINVSFLAISPNGKYLYACTEARMNKPGSVSAFSIDSLSGGLEFINKQSTGGRNPVHVTVGKNNEHVFIANYTDAGVCVFKTNPDGSLNPSAELIEFQGSSVIAGRQDESHLHSSYLSHDNRYVFAPDLGADKIRVLTFDKDNLLTVSEELEVQTAAGSGPRHFTFHPNDQFAYSIEELSGNVSAYTYHRGRLTLIDSYFSYTKQLDTHGAADIHISPDGRFLYASNRMKEENTISIFEINKKKGTLTLIGHQSTYGDHPRSFVIDPTGKFLLLANQNSGSIIVFKRNLKTGLLSKTDTEIMLNLPASLKMRAYSD